MSSLVYDKNLALCISKALITSNSYRITLTNERNSWFQWKSGILAPVYCNTRQLLSFPKERHITTAGLVAVIKEKFPEAEAIMGIATAGIAWATMVGYFQNLPVGYVRSTPKAHGLGNMVEYQGNTKKNIVLVDDLIASGESIKKTIDTLNNLDFNIIGVVSVVNWNFEKMHQNIQIPKIALCSYLEIVDTLNISENAKLDLINFYHSPFDYQWKSEEFKL